MTTQPNMSLQVGALDTATPVTGMKQQQDANAINHEKILRSHYEGLDAREKSRLSSTVTGAVQLKAFLDNGDLDGAHDFLVRRRNSLQNRIGMGENIDTEDTDAALDMLRRGNLEELSSSINGLMAAGRVYGIMDNDGTPSNVKEWQYYNSLTPEQQQEYLVMKRANPAINLGGTQMIPNPVNPAGPAMAEYEVTPKPEEMPDFKREQAQATTEGAAAGESTANANTTITKAGGLLAALENLKTSSANAPSGIVGDVGATVANKSGFGGDAANAQGDFSVKRAAAENAIREAFRVAGSGATSDRDALPFIDMLPVATDSDSVKTTKTDAAMQAVRTRVEALAQENGKPNPFAGGGASQKVVVTKDGVNGFEINIEDLPKAEAAGFKRQ